MDPITTTLRGGDNAEEHALAPTTTALATPAALALHNNFRSAVRALQRDLVRSLTYLVAIYDRKVHRALGYASITDYAAAVAGFSRNQTEAFLALGRRLDRYPLVRRALAEGTLTWSKARIIVERAQPEEECRWLEVAGRSSVRDLAVALSAPARMEPPAVPPVAPRPVPLPASEDEERASTRPSGASPPASPPPRARARLIGPVPAGEVCHLTYAFTPEEYALWTAAHGALRKLGRRESNAQLLIEALTELASGCGTPPGSPGPRYLLLIHQCPTCGEAAIVTHRGRHAAPQALLAASQCDAVVEDDEHRRRSIIPPRIRREVLQRDGHRCQAPGCGHMAFLEVHHRLPVAAGGRTVAENLVTLCARCHRELHRREEDLRQAGRDPVAD